MLIFWEFVEEFYHFGSKISEIIQPFEMLMENASLIKLEIIMHQNISERPQSCQSICQACRDNASPLKRSNDFIVVFWQWER